MTQVADHAMKAYGWCRGTEYRVHHCEKCHTDDRRYRLSLRSKNGLFTVKLMKDSRRRYPYFAWSNNPRNNVGITTGRASHARQVKSNEPEKKVIP